MATPSVIASKLHELAAYHPGLRLDQATEIADRIKARAKELRQAFDWSTREREEQDRAAAAAKRRVIVDFF